MGFNRRFKRQQSSKLKPFQGELMICGQCGRQEQSDPKKSSQWTAIQFDTKIGFTYICPTCFGNGTSIK